MSHPASPGGKKSGIALTFVNSLLFTQLLYLINLYISVEMLSWFNDLIL